MRQVPNVGYRQDDNITRWNYIAPEIDGDKPISVLEIGSNFGFMSLNVANKYPKSTVYSIEGSFGTGNSGSSRIKDISEIAETEGIAQHVKIKTDLGLSNNIVMCGIVSEEAYDGFSEAGIVFDYQISFSVFHWVCDVQRKSSTRELLAKHLAAAKTTFLELPSMEQPNALKEIYGPHNSVHEAIKACCDEAGMPVRITYLGSCAWYGTRDTFRIDTNTVPTNPSESQVIENLGMVTL